MKTAPTAAEPVEVSTATRWCASILATSCAENPKAWQEAHRRLYEHYKNLPEKELPDTLEEMEPLFAAVAHGCQAGLHQEAVFEVYYRRIQRDGRKNYCCNKLGAFGADLAALSNSFEKAWSEPAATLPDNIKAGVLNWAGFRLRALGRLAEAAEPMQAAVDLVAKNEDWKNAASGAGTLSELYLTLGEAAKAVAAARQSVDYADRSGDGFERLKQRSKLGDCLFRFGELVESEKLQREAEEIQKTVQPDYPYLYSGNGYRLCDLLLSQGQVAEVVQRASKMVEWENQGWQSLLDKALNRLSLGRAHTARALRAPGQLQSLSQAEDFLNQAVAGLREAGRQDIVPHGLLARAALYHMQGEFTKAWADLDEAYEIAERGGMGLHLADYHLEACRLVLAEGGGRSAEGKEQSAWREKAKAHLEQAAAMITKMGYSRRQPEVEALRQALGPE